MARAEVPEPLYEIRNPTSLQNQIKALKALKHDIIGHDQRKELVICHGIVGALAENLRGKRRSLGNGSLHDDLLDGDGGVEGHIGGVQEPGLEDEVRVQTIQIVTSLAHGGLAFVHPVLAGGVVAPLLSTLSPATVPPRVIVETLRSINAIAEALSTDILSPADSSQMAALANQLYSKPTVDCLAEILAQRNKSMVVDEQVTLVMKILSHTLRTFGSSQHPTALVKAGVLDFLASRLASLVASMGHALQRPEPTFISSLLPPPPKTSLVHLLEALTAITQHSAYRSLRLIYSQNLLAVFPITSAAKQQKQLSASEYYLPEQSSQSAAQNPLDYLLPKLQAVQNKNEHSFSKAFPALGSLVTPGDLSRMPYFNETQTMVSSRTISADEFGSPLIAWLIHMARNTLGLERLASLELLTHLISALDKNVMDSWADSSRNRDRTLAFLVVPLIIRILEDTSNPVRKKAVGSDEVSGWQVKERAPYALAVLVDHCATLQKAAVDANAIKLLCQMLKKSLDPVTVSTKPMWNPTRQDAASMDLEDDKTCILGPAALAPEAVHMLRCRGAALKGLAALAQKEDIHRKAVIDNGVVSCVVDSLVPYPDGPINAMLSPASRGNGVLDSKEGNPNFVIIAACQLTTALSRSVSILRTSLIDGGVAKPVFALLKGSDRGVREAATDAITNLVLQFSPMREELMSAGVLKILCEHAHVADPQMRISSLWALKHLANSAPNEVKIQVIEELGTGWIIQTMSGESPSSNSHRSHMATPNAAGEQVDLLNAVDEPSMEIDDAASVDSFSEDEDVMTDSIGTLRAPSIPAQHRARLKAIRQEEENPVIRGRREDVRVQEQVLDLVRNLISEAGPTQPEMIDHLLQSIGSQRLFECLGNKLKPKTGASAAPAPLRSSSAASTGISPAGKRPTLTTPGSTHAQTGNNHPQQPFPEHLYIDEKLLESVIFILIHIANGKPTHRHQLLNQTTSLSPTLFPSASSSASTTKLIDLTLPLFRHTNRRVRVACCWLVHNIMWMEDQSDAGGAKQRAVELRNRGFEDVVNVCVEDADLDVRERARGCVDVWGRLLGGNGSGLLRESVQGGGRAWER